MNATDFELFSELEEELEGEAMELEFLFSRRRATAQPFRKIAQRFGKNAWGAREFEITPPGLPIPGTIHRLDCPAGCPALSAAQCRSVVRRAIKMAIILANNAADKLETPTIETVGFFRSFFGHDPSTPISYAGNEASGVSIARRFRAVAKELGGARRIIFRCVPTRTPCTDNDFTCCDANTRAFSNQNVVPNVVHLCPPFWNLPEASRGGTILHEMLHILYGEFLGDTGRRANAHCYKAFALRVKGYARDLDATCACWDLPPDEECRRRLGLA